ncbi:MBOAT family protein [Blautia sp. OF03-15BH]|uniref:MBOAT family O-acyltransferase n=1 Tax=Blautia sp. OF03-15BH TaxID=2292287 RepID=UPI000E4F5F88|nr:MBOAT family protein [Blautia sp. OF03-15BH]RGY00140.1 MBOAT family protein [Blautia sp. OF03-15BH]
MVFSSMVFLCIFLPVVFLLHLLLPGIRAKNGMLLLASLAFYAYGEPVYVILMIASAFVNYLSALLIGKNPARKKAVMAVNVILNLGVLVLFKYTGFLAESVNTIFGTAIPMPSIRLPIGISFFTFQAMSYVIDVYRGVTGAQKNFGKVLLYISFFPQLIAGPIVKYHDIAQEIENRTQTVDGVTDGIRRFVVGLSKKVLISNTVGLVADTLFAADVSGLNAAAAWIGAVSYMLQIYFDFSGYSDMAIGLGEMFGFHFKENFNYPYISGSIREFWRRWHMSLSGWFQEYLYIPLGGSRKGKIRTVINKFIVFLCTGIWHGANVTFLFWGLYHGCFLMLEEIVPAIREQGGKVKSFFQHVYTLLVVLIGFVFFRADSMHQGAAWIKTMFTGFGSNTAAMSLALEQLTPLYLVTAAVGIVACCPVKMLVKKGRAYEAVTAAGSLALLLLCMLSLASGTYNPFIYFRF